ncbi:MAG TPA: LamG domain-containing protein [Dongiaceae bacterium]|nr:LamG domain-containing protein [Dongiaceae bacterium]
MQQIRRGIAHTNFIRGLIGGGLVSLALVVIVSVAAQAMTFSSTDYTIDTATLNNTGGFSSSADYQLTSSGGEAAIGNGASGSYKLAAGYAAQVITPAITVSTQPSGLLGEYSMNEGSGSTAYDSSSYASTGYTTSGPTWTTGKLGSALSFNGTQTVSMGNPTQLQTSPLTIEAWVKTSTSQNAAIVGKNNAWALNLTTAGAALYDYTAASNTCATSTSLANGTWHHLVATIQSGTTNGTTLYVDGVQQATCTVTVVNQSSAISIAGVSGTAQLNGSVDEVKFFNRSLNANEVAADYAAQNSGVPDGLTLQTILPGASNTANFTVTILTSGSSYSLAMNQNHDLQSGSNTIPAISGSITAPATWTEGTTKGLGFTLVNTNATAIPGKWSSGSAYAALPNSAATFYTRTGTQSSTDYLNMQLRADATASQASGAYSNTMTVTGTASL